jgi:hypothetical protein
MKENCKTCLLKSKCSQKRYMNLGNKKFYCKYWYPRKEERREGYIRFLRENNVIK